MQTKVERIKELVPLLNHYRNEYYNNSKSEISDFEYDKLFDELSTLESETGFVMTVSPTQTVGYEVKSTLIKVKHNHPMLSLDKTKSVDDIVKFLDGRVGICMAKMDGLTCSLRYVDGELVSAETRGNGEVGEDVLHCAKTIKNIPLKINCTDEVIIDGEVIIAYDDFEKINATLPEDKKYKHPRNLASGSIRQLDSNVAAQRNLKFIAWKLIKADYMPRLFSERLIVLSKLGFETVPFVFDKKSANKHDIESWINVTKKICEEEKYPIDGCVIGYDDAIYGESLGATNHHLRSQLAFKFYDELYPTRLQCIDWTIGKTSQLTPTAVFESVEIDGTEVQRASLHNISIIKNLGLTNGCTVNVFKANQIIPQIDSCENDGNGEIEIPTTCPICGGATAINKDNESEVLVCTNPNCSGKLLAKFVHFVSRKCMNIEGLAEALLERLISLNYINSFQDIYHLVNYRDQLVKLDGLGAKSVQKLLLSIEKSRNVKLENFIAALGIEGVGLSTAKLISEFCHNDWMEFYHIVYSLSERCAWYNIDGIGKVTSDAVNKYFSEHKNEITELAEELKFDRKEKTETKENPFIGKNICVTGKLNAFNRDSINAKIAELGAKAVSGVNTKTDYLITNTPDSGSSKNINAKKFGTKIITEEQFLQMIKERR